MAYFLQDRHPVVWRSAGWVGSAVAAIWRRLLFRTTFIAITGSVGKTTAKELTGAILSSRFRIVMTFDTQNGWFFIPRTILSARPWHRFAVLELATNRPGVLWKKIRWYKPEIGVILSVARTHGKHFQTLEGIAAEKARLLDALRRGGTAILNGDDDRVRAMARSCRARVLMFGRSPEFDVWASDVSSTWPERLAFRVHWRNESLPVSTRLVGEHWLSVALSAITVALSCGMDLGSIVSALEKVEPYRARLEPVPLPSGAILLRDDFNDEMSTLEPALQVLEKAVARRRVLILSGAVDPLSKAGQKIAGLGERVARSADLLILVGDHGRDDADSAIRAGMDQSRVFSFTDLPQAAEFLKSNLQEGDLVLLRGYLFDHVQRLYFAQLGTVGCWKRDCRRQFLCDHCPELRPGLENANAVAAPVRPFWQPL